MPKNSKKVTKRERSKYPNLDRSVNTKRLRYYIDNNRYMDGVKNEHGQTVIREMSEEEKQWLNKFNGEYYNGSFNEDDSKNLHQTLATKEEIESHRDMIRELKSELKYTKDPEQYRELKMVVDEQVEILKDMYPRKKCTDTRNAINRDLINIGHAMNTVKFIPWDVQNENTIGTYELNYIHEDDEDDDL